MNEKKTHKAAIALLSMQRHSWEQGCAMQAFYELGRMDIVIPMAREAANRAMDDGRPATIGVTDGVTDPCAAGQALHAAALLTNDTALRKADEALLHWALEAAPRNERGILYHLNTGRQFWADSIYMLPPYLAAMGHVDAALRNLYGYWDALYDADAGLMCHMWDEATQSFADAAHWGTGNGWTLAGIARVLHLLPETYSGDRSRLVSMARTLLNKVLSFRGSDGSFCNVLDDPASFREWNLTQMVCYTLYTGMADGWLPEEYAPVALELKEAAEGAMDEIGFLRPVCGAPTFDRPGISPEAQAFFLLMQSAAQRFAAISK